jgi:tetratricopeptide (TPR) repeat protein
VIDRLLLAILLAAACTRSPPKLAATPAAPDKATARDEGGGQLAKVRPPRSPCLGARGRGEADDLTEKALDALDRNDGDRALGCAEEALQLTPEHLPALHARAAALVALGKLDEARVAYARALAAAPDDAEVLRGAADLYVSRLGSDRELLDLGRAYAARGLAVALKAPKPDRELAAGLATLAAMAENDLGESRAALGHAEESLREEPGDADALYERGVALYELCRFAESRQAFDEMLKKVPEDPWALHYLGLLAERSGDRGHADEYQRKARTLSPGEFRSPVELDEESFRREVAAAVAALPEVDRKAIRDVPVEVADLPGLDDLTATDPPLSPSILGLFRGPSEQEACQPGDGPRCRSIVLYRKNLARFARDRAELSEQVKVTLLHEIGHLRGENDEDLRARGLE